MFTHSYSFNPDICLHIHLAKCTATVRLLNQAGRNNYPNNPKFVGNSGNRTRDLRLDKCILYLTSYQQLNHLSDSASQ